MNKKTFEIMYQALVEIASSPVFFEKEKRMARIAKIALQDIGKLTEESSDRPRRKQP